MHRGSNPGVAVRFQRYSSLARLLLHSQKPPSTMDYSSSSPIIVVVNTRRDGGGGAIVLVEEKRRCSSFALGSTTFEKMRENATICRQPKLYSLV